MLVVSPCASVCFWLLCLCKSNTLAGTLSSPYHLAKSFLASRQLQHLKILRDSVDLTVLPHFSHTESPKSLTGSRRLQYALCVKALGIRFTDNDFYHTVRSFLVLIQDQGLDGYEGLTKDQLAELFNQSAYGLYLLAQNKLQYSSGIAASYLKITAKNVYVDSEVYEHLTTFSAGDNCEFFYLIEGQGINVW